MHQIVRIHIKLSKTEPFRNGADIHSGRTYHNVCPVIRGKQPDPLFVLADNTILPEQFSHQLLKCTPVQHTSSGLEQPWQPIKLVYPKALGHWKSDAYQRYIRTPTEQLANLSEQIVQGTYNDL